MKKQTYKGFEFEIYENGKNGADLFVISGGNVLYSCRVLRSQALSRAREIINRISR